MSATRRITLVMTVALALIVGILAAALFGVISSSSAIWFSAGVAVVALVAARFHRHAALPDSVKLH